jgi:hypothetical protein
MGDRGDTRILTSKVGVITNSCVPVMAVKSFYKTVAGIW